jgi:apolipoprotein D and lipocalin family protein
MSIPKRAKTFFTILIAAIFSAGCSTASHPPLPTVESVDLERYSGRWVEIARYENRFEKGCVSASADYLLAGDSVSVINRCYDANGTLIGEAAGRARVVEKSANAKLKVSFFWPFQGDYWILKLSEGYRYSVVGDPSRKYLWILGRESTLTEGEQKAILAYLPTIGYDANKLYWTKPLP